jgi:hypothetical protein
MQVIRTEMLDEMWFLLRNQRYALCHRKHSMPTEVMWDARTILDSTSYPIDQLLVPLELLAQHT